MPQSSALPAPTRRQGASVNLAEPRAARTHESLTNALFDLLRQHDLTEISISELCRTAGVHRTTFYGHYADIYAFAGDSFASILDDVSGAIPVALGQRAVTAKLDIDFTAPVVIGRELVAEAWLQSFEGRKIRIVSRLLDDGVVLAVGHALFLTVPREHFRGPDISAPSVVP